MPPVDAVESAEPPAPLDLSGTWRAGVADEELRRTWYSDAFDDRDFVDVTTPGHWRAQAAFADNDDPLLYRRRFSTVTLPPARRAWLLLDGVCSQGDVWLDEEYLGNTDGAWVPHRFEVTGVLQRRNEHVIGIEVASPTVGDRSSKRGLLGTWQDGPYVRPGWNPGGIWRPVRLVRTGPVAVTAHRVLCTSATADLAVVTVTCTLDAAQAGEVTLRTAVGGVDDERRQPLAAGRNVVTWNVGVPEPRLWWPRALGDQPLVDVTVEVCTDPTDDGVVRAAAATTDAGSDQVGRTVSDRFVTRVGLRQVTLRDWILTVNGERLFTKGVVAGPAAHELATAPAGVFEEQVARAVDVGADLLRVHGHVGRDELYDAADRAGLVVWQDLPLYRGQNRSVRRVALRTAEAVVDRLGSHPSIVVWCGHDEPDHVEATGGVAGLGRRALAHELPNWGRSVLDRSVKRALVAADPSRPVIGSSGTWPHPPALAGTDTHLDLGWSAGEAEDLARLARTVPRAVRFVQITPSPSSTRAPASTGRRVWPPDDTGVLVGGDRGVADLMDLRLPPAGFETADDWHRATLNYQAELIRTQVETLRRLKYHPTGGYTVAHLADLEDVTAPSLIDHAGTPKPAYEALRRANAPVLVTLSPWPHCTHPGETLTPDVHVVNDTRVALSDARLVVDARFDPAVDSDDDFTTESDDDDTDLHWTFGGDIGADAVGRVGRIHLPVTEGLGRITVRLRLFAPGPIAEAVSTVPVHHH